MRTWVVIEWVKINKGYAKSLCGRYQMSLVGGRGFKPRYTAFAVTGSPMNPISCLGARDTPEAAKALCEEHLKKTRGAECSA